VAATFAVAAAIALLAWSPMLVNSMRSAPRPQMGSAAQDVPTYVRIGVTEPVRRRAGGGWYTPSLVSQVRMAPLPGPYSPLVVQPPIRRVSSEY
jgi:hypothetical protein